MSRAALVVIDELNLAEEMTAPLDQWARHARTQLGAEVSREAVIHAGVAGWLEHPERQEHVTIWAINNALRSDTPLHPNVQHWPAEMADRLDHLARKAGRELYCEVSRSAVVRAALTGWLIDAARRPREVVAQAIRASVMTLAQLEATPR